MKRSIRAEFLIAAIAITIAAMPGALLAPAAAHEVPTDPRQVEAFTIGVQAYIYGYPLVEMYRTREAMALRPENPNYAPINQFDHMRHLLGPEFTDVVSPNNDTLYSTAWLELGPEPIVLHVPPTDGRYYVFQLIDFYTNVIDSVGSRTRGTHGGDYAIVGPDWGGTLPKGIEEIRSPTNSVWVIGRTLIHGKDDEPAVHALQDQYTLTPLGRWGKTTAPEAAAGFETPPPYDVSNPLKFFEILNYCLRHNPPPFEENALMGLFERIGVGPWAGFRAEELDSATAAGLTQAIAFGQQIIANETTRMGTIVNGWNILPRNAGRFGNDYLLRAAVAMKGLGVNVPEEAIYPIVDVDSQGRQLNGRHRYVLDFDQGPPPVDAFWSLTMYRQPERLLAANPIDRYSIGDRTEGVKFREDGTLKIFVQHGSPEEGRSNWLPAPEGDFYLVLRAYNPKPEMLNGTWKPPAVKRVEDRE